MKAKLTLRAAAAVMLLHDVGHTFGALTWKNTTDPVKAGIIKQMTENKFPFMGATRSMADYLDGYGFLATLALLLIAALLWIVSDTVSQNEKQNMKIIAGVSIVLLLVGIDELIYFFPLAASMSLIASLLGFYSYVNIKGLLVKQRL